MQRQQQQLPHLATPRCRKKKWEKKSNQKKRISLMFYHFTSPPNHPARGVTKLEKCKLDCERELRDPFGARHCLGRVLCAFFRYLKSIKSYFCHRHHPLVGPGSLVWLLAPWQTQAPPAPSPQNPQTAVINALAWQLNHLCVPRHCPMCTVCVCWVWCVCGFRFICYTCS